MKHFTVKHARHTSQSQRGEKVPGNSFRANVGAAAGSSAIVPPLQDGESPQSEGPQTFCQGGYVNQRK